MVIFSVLLLISRLRPSFQLVDSSNEGADSESSAELLAQEKSRDQSIHEFIELIKGFA